MTNEQIYRAGQLHTLDTADVETRLADERRSYLASGGIGGTPTLDAFIHESVRRGGRG